MDGHSIVFLLGRFINEIVDGGANLMVGAYSFVCRDVLFVPIDEATQAAAFSFVGFSFSSVVLALAFAFSFPFRTPAASAGLPDVVSVAASRFGICW